MQGYFLNFKSSRVHYSVGGSGNHALICFHGYGESEHSFHFLEKNLPPKYKLVAIDMPYHGHTEWNEGMNFSEDDLLTLVDEMLRKQDIYGPVSVLGYSMGGRMSLLLLEKKAAMIERVVLLAPDGLKLNFWYWLATQTWIGNKIFAATIHNPSWFLGMLKLLNRLKWLNQSVYKFVDYFLHDASKRKILYLRWTCLRKIKPNLKEVKKQVLNYQTTIHLVYGRHDRIIVPSRGETFQKQLEGHCTIEIIDSGHQLLQEKNIGVLLNYFRN